MQDAEVCARDLSGVYLLFNWRKSSCWLGWDLGAAGSTTRVKSCEKGAGGNYKGGRFEKGLRGGDEVGEHLEVGGQSW